MLFRSSEMSEDDIKAINKLIFKHKKNIVFILTDERLECELLLERDKELQKFINYRINMQY